MFPRYIVYIVCMWNILDPVYFSLECRGFFLVAFYVCPGALVDCRASLIVADVQWQSTRSNIALFRPPGDRGRVHYGEAARRGSLAVINSNNIWLQTVCLRVTRKLWKYFILIVIIKIFNHAVKILYIYIYGMIESYIYIYIYTYIYYNESVSIF